jgi:hypothetical protein
MFFQNFRSAAAVMPVIMVSTAPVRMACDSSV